MFQTASVDKSVLQCASANNSNDYEESVIYTAAERNGVDVIVTRDTKGFALSKVTVMSPEVFLAGVGE